MKRHKAVQAILLGVMVGGLTISGVAQAWGQAGHQTVGAIAEVLLQGTTADAKVHSLLGMEKLRTTALWADCAKGVNDTTLKFTLTTHYPECDPFQQTAAGRQAMVNYVRRNLRACQPKADEEVCHKQYHYADVAIERDNYATSDVGTSDHDIVHAISAAIAKLKGDSVPAPFSFSTKKEALRLLVHWVGDIHQPLHVGAVYLNAAGQVVDPDAEGLDPAMKTHGGNLIFDGSAKLHGEWDAIPVSLDLAHFKVGGAADAQRVPVTAGPVESWPAAWATETVVASHAAYQGLSYQAEQGAGTAHPKWPVTEPAGYAVARAALQKEQLVKAGARLAQVLEAVWP